MAEFAQLVDLLQNLSKNIENLTKSIDNMSANQKQIDANMLALMTGVHNLKTNTGRGNPPTRRETYPVEGSSDEEGDGGEEFPGESSERREGNAGLLPTPVRPRVPQNQHSLVPQNHSGHEERRVLKYHKIKFSMYDDTQDLMRWLVRCDLHPTGLLPLPIPKSMWADISMDFIEGLPKVFGKKVTSPFQLVYGREPPQIRSYGKGEAKVAAVLKGMADRDDYIRDTTTRLLHAQHYTKKYDAHHTAIEFNIGDWVWLRLARGRRQVLVQWLDKDAAEATWEDMEWFTTTYPTFKLEYKLFAEGKGDVMWHNTYRRNRVGLTANAAE